MSPYSSQEKDIRALLIGGALILLIGIYFFGRFLFSGSESEEKVVTSPIEQSDTDKNLSISPEVVRQKLLNQEPIVFLDIRGEEAFSLEHIPNAISLSTGALSTYTPKPQDILIIVHSENDLQSYLTAKTIIEQRGLTAFFLEGGFEGWKEKNSQTVSLGDPNSFIDQSKVVYINNQELLALMNDPTSNIVIIDVQTKENFNRVHLRGAINIPLDEIEKHKAEIPANKPLIVYGENELASFQAGVRLADLNIFTARTLSGNKNLTTESGLPLEPPK